MNSSRPSNAVENLPKILIILSLAFSSLNLGTTDLEYKYQTIFAPANSIRTRVQSDNDIQLKTQPVIADSRFRYEPLLPKLGIQEFLESRSSVLAEYRVPGPDPTNLLLSSQVIEEASLDYQIAPQVLLTLLEIQSGLVTAKSASNDRLLRPMDLPVEEAIGFRAQIRWTARFLDEMAPRYSAENQQKSTQALVLKDGIHIIIPFDRSPTTALIRFLGKNRSADEILAALSEEPKSFQSVYQEFFSESPLSFPLELSANLSGARLPFAGTKRYTGGPHGGGSTIKCSQIALGSGSGIDFSRNNQNDNPNWVVLSILSGMLLSRDSNVSGGIGNRVRIKHSDSLVSEYWHLSSFSSQIQKKNIGDSIPLGFPIGMAGNTGGQSSVHLHLELRTPSGTPIQWDGETIDGYRIGFHRVYSNQSLGYNYQGSAVLDGTKFRQITADCGGSNGNLALVGVNYNNNNEQNGVDPNTVFADTRDDANAGRVDSSNVIPGDANCDAKVDILDYVILWELFGKQPQSCKDPDFNDDGEVNVLDYVILFENFGLK